MGGMNVGGGGGGKKSLDSEIPLVPFIDLLLCCVMFLLVTAVWNQLARINIDQQVPGQSSSLEPPPEQQEKLQLKITKNGYEIGSSLEQKTPIPKAGTEYDLATLRIKLQEQKRLKPNNKEIMVGPEDGVIYSDVIGAMDLASAEGFSKLALLDGTTM